MVVVLQIVGVVLCVVASLWIIWTGSTWLLDRGKMSRAPLLDRAGRLATKALQKEAYDERVDAQHRLYLRLRRGFPWAVMLLILGIGLVIIGSQ